MQLESTPESIKVTFEANDRFGIHPVNEIKGLVCLQAGQTDKGGVQVTIHLTNEQLFHLRQGIEAHLFSVMG